MGGRATPARAAPSSRRGGAASAGRNASRPVRPRSRSASRGRRGSRARTPMARLRPSRRCGPPVPFSAPGRGSCRRRGRGWSRRVCDKSAAFRTGSSMCGTPARYPITDASYKLTESRESPILGYKALREVGRWLGSRHGPPPFPDPLGDADAAAASGRCSAVGAASAATGPRPVAPGGDT